MAVCKEYGEWFRVFSINFLLDLYCSRIKVGCVTILPYVDVDKNGALGIYAGGVGMMEGILDILYLEGFIDFLN